MSAVAVREPPPPAAAKAETVGELTPGLAFVLETTLGRRSSDTLILIAEALYQTALFSIAMGVGVASVDEDIRRHDYVRLRKWVVPAEAIHDVAKSRSWQKTMRERFINIPLWLLHFDVGAGLTVAAFLKELLTDREGIFNAVEWNRGINIRKELFARLKEPTQVVRQKQ